jgi:hypothetical protein
VLFFTFTVAVKAQSCEQHSDLCHIVSRFVQVLLTLHAPLFDRLPFLKHKHPNFLEQILPHMKLEFYAATEYVVWQNDISSQMYFIGAKRCPQRVCASVNNRSMCHIHRRCDVTKQQTGMHRAGSVAASSRTLDSPLDLCHMVMQQKECLKFESTRRRVAGGHVRGCSILQTPAYQHSISSLVAVTVKPTSPVVTFIQQHLTAS